MGWLCKPVSMPSRDRVPPGQTLTTRFPVLHADHPPEFDPKIWTLTSVSDFHCVTDWSRLENRCEGAAFRAIVERVQPSLMPTT
jgi:DMSO/TMAO reductase YedYZ molybdopterin-dependent catalytic subunit